MPLARRILALATAATLVLGLAACASEPERPHRTSSPVHTPRFASDEEALAAATDAYAAYNKVSDDVSSEGGGSSKKLKMIVTPEQLARETASFDKLAASGKRSIGVSSFDTVSLVKYDSEAEEVEVYVCLDISATRLVDASNTDVTPVDRQDRLPLNVQFVLRNGTLLLSASDVWSGDDFC